MCLFLAQSQPSRAALAVRPGTAGHAGYEKPVLPEAASIGGLAGRSRQGWAGARLNKAGRVLLRFFSCPGEEGGVWQERPRAKPAPPRKACPPLLVMKKQYPTYAPYIHKPIFAQPGWKPKPGQRLAAAFAWLLEQEENAFVDEYRRLYARHTEACQAAMEMADQGDLATMRPRQKLRQIRQAQAALASRVWVPGTGRLWAGPANHKP